MALPATPLLYRSKLLGCAVESTIGTSALSSVTAPLGMIVTDAKMVPVNFLEGGERKPISKFMGRHASALGKRAGRLTFRSEVRHGDGTLTLLRGCGFTSSGVPISKSTAWEGLSFKLWEPYDTSSGRVKQLTGAMGTVQFTFAAGQGLMADWTFDGVWNDPASSAGPAETPITTVTRYTHASTATLASSAIPNFSTCTIDVGNTVSMRDDAKVAAGLLHGFVGDRDPTITFDFEAHLLADFNPFATLLAGTQQALSLVLTDGTNTLTIAAPKCQYRDIGDDARDTRLSDSLTLQACISSGNDEITFTFA